MKLADTVENLKRNVTALHFVGISEPRNGIGDSNFIIFRNYHCKKGRVMQNIARVRLGSDRCRIFGSDSDFTSSDSD